jgi:hypothetical protein
MNMELYRNCTWRREELEINMGSRTKKMTANEDERRSHFTFSIHGNLNKRWDTCSELLGTWVEK